MDPLLGPSGTPAQPFQKTLDSINHELSRYKGAARLSYFDQLVSNNTKKIDTLS